MYLTDNECKVCKLIRAYVLIAVPLVLILGAQALNEDAALQSWMPGVVLIDMLAYGALGALLIIVGVRFKKEFIEPKRKQKRLNKIREGVERESPITSDDL
jgi:hypothetical protein